MFLLSLASCLLWFLTRNATENNTKVNCFLTAHSLMMFLSFSHCCFVSPQAFVISFTSDFIPRLVYQYVYSPDGTLHGFVNHSLSYFNVTDFQPGTDPVDPMFLGYKVEVCRCWQKSFRTTTRTNILTVFQYCTLWHDFVIYITELSISRSWEGGDDYLPITAALCVCFNPSLVRALDITEA